MSPNQSHHSIRTEDYTDLRPSPALRRLMAHLQDLIVISHEGCINTLGKSLRLEKLRYVSGEKLEDKYCMLFEGLVKDLELNANTMIQLTFAVNLKGTECSENY